jgi:biopolymer transport protein ExbD
MITKRKRRESIAKETEVELTPLIDCIFLLLIFFMVTTVFIQTKGLTVDLPAPGDTEEQDQKKKDINVAVTSEGQFTVNGETVPAASLEAAIREAMDMNNNRNVIIQGDPSSMNRDVVFVMDESYAAGAEGMAFAIEETAQE